MQTHAHTHMHTHIHIHMQTHAHTHTHIYEKTILSRCDHLKLFCNCYAFLKDFRETSTLSNEAVVWSIKKDQN